MRAGRCAAINMAILISRLPVFIPMAGGGAPDHLLAQLQIKLEEDRAQNLFALQQLQDQAIERDRCQELLQRFQDLQACADKQLEEAVEDKRAALRQLQQEKEVEMQHLRDQTALALAEMEQGCRKELELRGAEVQELQGRIVSLQRAHARDAEALAARCRRLEDDLELERAAGGDGEASDTIDRSRNLTGKTFTPDVEAIDTSDCSKNLTGETFTPDVEASDTSDCFKNLTGTTFKPDVKASDTSDSIVDLTGKTFTLDVEASDTSTSDSCKNLTGKTLEPDVKASGTSDCIKTLTDKTSKPDVEASGTNSDIKKREEAFEQYMASVAKLVDEASDNNTCAACRRQFTSGKALSAHLEVCSA